MVERLDAGLYHLAEVFRRDLGADVLNGGFVAILGAKLQAGIETVLNEAHFADRLSGADMVLTGEGRINRNYCAARP